MKTATFNVTLRSSGNPDHGQFFDAGVLAPSLVRYCASIEACQQAVRAYIEEFNLGGGSWTGGLSASGNQLMRLIAR